MIHHALRAVALALLALSATAAQADDRVSPQEFSDFALGWTLYYEEDGEPAGAEHFRPDGRVRWRDGEGACVDGVWRAYQDQVCFYYGPGTDVLCWSLHRLHPGGNILVRLLGDGEDAGLELEIVDRDRKPLICKGEGAAS